MKWQPISTAPKDGTEILLFCRPDGHMKLRHRYGVGQFATWRDGTILWDWPWSDQPTHWMPLPPPPEEAT